jgi:hypothetical protein
MVGAAPQAARALKMIASADARQNANQNTHPA